MIYRCLVVSDCGISFCIKSSGTSAKPSFLDNNPAMIYLSTIYVKSVEHIMKTELLFRQKCALSCAFRENLMQE